MGHGYPSQNVETSNGDDQHQLGKYIDNRLLLDNTSIFLLPVRLAERSQVLSLEYTYPSAFPRNLLRYLPSESRS